jgi:hypothetical protein
LKLWKELEVWGRKMEGIAVAVDSEKGKIE